MAKGISPAALKALADGDMENFLVAATPGGIELQESAGQQAFVGTKSSLPRECPRADLERLGFKFGNPIDDLFIEVTFPEGWSKRTTDHSMWSDLLDAKGRKRAAIFYRAAFYDRSATMHSLQERYTTSADYLDDSLKPSSGNSTKFRATVIDNATEETLFKTEVCAYRDWEAHGRLKIEAAEWLKAHFPQHGDAFSYWD